jgi:phosphomannomutase
MQKKMELRHLQNGSDIRGIALEGIAGEDVNLTSENVKLIGKAFVKWFENNFYAPSSIAIGMDSRLSGPALKDAIIEGINSMGVDVWDCGMASTPAMFMTTMSNRLLADAAVMLTASHLPFNRNGLKFFTIKGGLNKPDITEILKIAETGYYIPEDERGTVMKVDFINDYAETLVDYVRSHAEGENLEQPLLGFKIVVDAGNGAGGFFAEKVLKVLGADIEGSQFLEPDGIFPNHVPNPEDPAAMQSVCEAVLNAQADLGVIFDTDVDRAAIVDPHGKPINRNELIALVSAIVLDEHPGSTIVTDSVTSDGLAEFINRLGGVHHRYRRGYKNVINEAQKLNASGIESQVAIETSGHAAFKENHFLDDGAFLIAKILAKMARMKNQGQDLFSLISTLKIPHESIEKRLKIRIPDFARYGAGVIEHMRTVIDSRPDWIIEHPNHEGIRVKCTNPDEQGWFLIRMSLHDPVLPVNVESDVPGGTNRIYSQIREILSGFEHLE